MARAKGKKTNRPATPKPVGDATDLNPLRAGMPAKDSITGVDEFRRGKQVYRIIHTNEVDEYEEELPPVKKKKQ